MARKKQKTSNNKNNKKNINTKRKKKTKSDDKPWFAAKFPPQVGELVLAFEQLWEGRVVEKRSRPRKELQLQWKGFHNDIDEDVQPWLSEHQVVPVNRKNQEFLHRFVKETLQSSTIDDGLGDYDDDDDSCSDDNDDEYPKYSKIIKPQKRKKKGPNQVQSSKVFSEAHVAAGKTPQLGDTVYTYELLWVAIVKETSGKPGDQWFRVQWDGFHDNIEQPWISEHQMVFPKTQAVHNFLTRLARNTFLKHTQNEASSGDEEEEDDDVDVEGVEIQAEICSDEDEVKIHRLKDDQSETSKNNNNHSNKNNKRKRKGQHITDDGDSSTESENIDLSGEVQLFPDTDDDDSNSSSSSSSPPSSSSSSTLLSDSDDDLTVQMKGIGFEETCKNAQIVCNEQIDEATYPACFDDVLIQQNAALAKRISNDFLKVLQKLPKKEKLQLELEKAQQQKHYKNGKGKKQTPENKSKAIVVQKLIHRYEQAEVFLSAAVECLMRGGTNISRITTPARSSPRDMVGTAIHAMKLQTPN